MLLLGPTLALDAVLTGAVAQQPVRWVHLTGRHDRPPGEVDRHLTVQSLDRELAAGGWVGALPRSEQPDATDFARFTATVIRSAQRVAHGRRVTVVGCAVTIAARRWGLPRLLIRFGEPVVVRAGDAVDSAVSVDAALQELQVAPTAWDGLVFQAGLTPLLTAPGLPARERSSLRSAFVARYGRISEEPDVREARLRFSALRDRLLALGCPASGQPPVGLAVRNALLLAAVPFQFFGGALLAPLRFGTAQALFGHSPKLMFGSGLGLSLMIAVALAVAATVAPTVAVLGLASAVVAGSGWVERRCVSIARLLRHASRMLRPLRDQPQHFVEQLAVSELTTRAVTHPRMTDHGRLFPPGSQDYDVRGSSILRDGTGSNLVR